MPVDELSGPHLIAEYRELPRVYGLSRRALARGVDPATLPSSYRLGTGHVLFFYCRLTYVVQRHRQLVAEMRRRGYQPSKQFCHPPSLAEWPRAWRQRWVPSEADLATNRQRLFERS